MCEQFETCARSCNQVQSRLRLTALEATCGPVWATGASGANDLSFVGYLVNKLNIDLKNLETGGMHKAARPLITTTHHVYRVLVRERDLSNLQKPWF